MTKYKHLFRSAMPYKRYAEESFPLVFIFATQEVRQRNEVLLSHIKRLQELKIALNAFLSGNDLATIAGSH